MNTIQEANQAVFNPSVQASLFREDKSDLIEAGIRWSKIALNVADYIPLSGINCYSAGIRMYAAIGYMIFAVLQFGYSSFVRQNSDAKKILDRQLAKGFKYLLRGGLSYSLNNYSFMEGGVTKAHVVKNPWSDYKLKYDSKDQVATVTNALTRSATAILFGSYDYYVSKQDGKEKWFSFYA